MPVPLSSHSASSLPTTWFKDLTSNTSPPLLLARLAGSWPRYLVFSRSLPAAPCISTEQPQRRVAPRSLCRSATNLPDAQTDDGVGLVRRPEVGRPGAPKGARRQESGSAGGRNAVLGPSARRMVGSSRPSWHHPPPLLPPGRAPHRIFDPPCSPWENSKDNPPDRLAFGPSRAEADAITPEVLQDGPVPCPHRRVIRCLLFPDQSGC